MASVKKVPIRPQHRMGHYCRDLGEVVYSIGRNRLRHRCRNIKGNWFPGLVPRKKLNVLADQRRYVGSRYTGKPGTPFTKATRITNVPLLK